MSKEQSQELNSQKREKLLDQDNRSLLRRRLIWQHLAEKKIKKAIRARFKMTDMDN